jgi:hypothetical protein
MRSRLSRQRGMTAIGWVAMVFLFGMLAMAGLRLVPVYVTSQSINSIMRSVASSQEAADIVQIRRSIDRHLQVNDINIVTSRDFELVREGGQRILVLDYEHRVPFIGSIDFIVSFEKRQEVRRQ